VEPFAASRVLVVVTSEKEQGIWAMKPLVVFGILLIAIGIAGLLIDNISFTEKRVVVDAGPLKVTADQQRIIPIPSIAGVIAIVAGAGMIFFGRRGAKA
jgi:nitrate reductase gamma subunit